MRAAGFFFLLTTALTYPLLGRMGSTVAHDAGDPLLNTWILWWSTQAIPLTASWWNAPIFYPMANALALSEILVGLLPISAAVQLLTGNPLAAYNAAFLLSFPLCGLAAYALALELTGRRAAALVAGVAFACAPYRVAQLSHVQMLSYYWAPLALLGLHRYLRTRRPAMLVLFGVSWLMQALSNSYSMFHLSVLVALWVVWFVRDARAFLSIAVAWTASALPMAPILLRYRAVHDELHLVRDINEIKRFGADVADFLSAPRELLVWGRSLGTDHAETALFPGLTVVVVGVVWVALEWRRGRFREDRSTRDRQVFLLLAAAAGLAALSTVTIGPWHLGPLTVASFYKPFSLALGFRGLASLRSAWMRRAWRDRSTAGFYVVATAAMYLLALGPEPRLLGRPLLYEPPYAWLMRLPGFDVMRVPARFAMAAVLGQSLLLALAVARWTPRSILATPVAALMLPTRRVVAAALCLGLFVDGWIHLPVAAAPERGPGWQGVAAVAELPPGDPGVDFGALYRSMFHRAKLVNAFSGYYPPHYLPLAYAVREGHHAALRELAPDGPLGVGVRRSQNGAADLIAALERSEGIGPGESGAGWVKFRVQPASRVPVALGAKIRVATLSANRHPEDVGRMLDASVATAWGSGLNQIGDEEVTVELETPQAVGAIVFEMGALAFGFPRRLDIDVSADVEAWVPVWSGETSVETVRAAVASPGGVPLTLAFQPTMARRIRLRQRGAEPGIPWWIAELSVHAPAK